ncbi:MAG TPA: DinB family protein [Thermoplasmata archaeon]|nr:DinB family protein [Thermoplasmata archaeon]
MPFADPEFRSDLERMLVYHSWARNKYLDLFERLPWRVLTRRRGATFESIRNVHLHVMAAYAWWLVQYFGQRRLRPLLRRLDDSRWVRIRSVGQMRAIDRQVDAVAQAVARRFGPEDFDRKKMVSIPGGKKFPVTPRQVLWHLVEEDFLHHGEILCMLWQDDIEPPYTGVWWFEYDHDPARHPDSWHADPEMPRPPAGGYVAAATRKARKTNVPRRGRRPTR